LDVLAATAVDDMSIPPFFDFLTLSYNDCFVFYRKLMLSGEQIFFQTVELLAPADGRAARGVRFERVDLMDRDFRLAVVVGEKNFGPDFVLGAFVDGPHEDQALRRNNFDVFEYRHAPPGRTSISWTMVVKP
jgi:hypothetical protein